jgi:hypothetical protein
MLKDENTRLKRLLADAAMLDNAALAHRTRAIFGADLLSSDRIPSRDSPISGEPETNSSRRDIALIHESRILDVAQIRIQFDPA